MGKAGARVPFAEFFNCLCFRVSRISRSTADVTAYEATPHRMAQLITTKRGKIKLAYDGFTYIFDRFDSDCRKRFWCCENKNECGARIHTSFETGEERFVRF